MNPLVVNCPCCGQKVAWVSESRYRPFCSERCRQMDLGAWAAEKYTIEGNPEQRAAVTLPDESALILAGAGSGKTRVLTTRIAWLLQSQRIRPAEILAV